MILAGVVLPSWCVLLVLGAIKAAVVKVAGTFGQLTCMPALTAGRYVGVSRVVVMRLLQHV